jgi:hypothetical protein
MPAVRRLLVLLLLTTGCSSNAADDIVTHGRFRAEVWADNWFAFSLGEKAVFEDSVSITTERSFNKEVFGFDGDFPLVLNFVVKDYKADDSGLEYIGTSRQQMGDGGFIAQIKDTTTGKYVAVTNSSWKCLVIHRAPLDTGCEKSGQPGRDCTARIDPEPAAWRSPSFDTSEWPAAVEYAAEAVDPKMGYSEVRWSEVSKLIWSSSLKQDNTVLCRVVVAAP